MAGEEQYRRLFEEATEGICLADRDTGIIQDCNRAFLQLTGYERSELIGQPQSILHPAEGIRPPHSKNFLLHRSEKRGEVLHDLLVTKSGEIKEIEVKAGPIELGGRQLMHGFFRDTTEEIRNRHERETSLTLMRLLNDRNHTHELIRSLTEFLHEWTGCEAVGIRLKDGDDFPYFETRGFPGEFIELENNLCALDLEGQIVRDEIGNPVLECMCGNVLCGRFDPKLPFFTEKGSFWSNCTTELLATTSEEERQTRTRNRCNTAGYESVALIPLKHRNRILGLMQLNDRARGKFTPELIAFLENASDQIAVALDQRQTQAALEASEERYRRLFEVETDALFLVDLETLRFIDANASALKLFGYTREELSRMKVGDFSVNPEETQRAIAAEETFIPLRWFRKKDGTVFAAEISISIFESKERRFHVAAIRDITERRRAETAIRESQRQNELLAKILEYSSQPFIMGYADGRIGLYNSAFEEMLGYEKDELKNADWLNGLTPPEWKEFSKRNLEELRSTGTSIRYEKEYFSKDGRRVPIEAYVHAVPDVAGDSLYYYAFITDISERKRVEEEKRKMAQAIQEERDRLSALVNSIDEEVWFTDTEKRFVLANPSACKAFGLESADAIDVEKFAASLDIYRPDGTPRPLEEAMPLIALQGKTVRNEEELVRIPSTGELRHREVSSAPVRDGEGKVIGSVSVVRDITEYKRLEKSRLESEQKYRSLFENSMDAVFLGKPDGTILSANRAACEMFGLSEEEICRAGRNGILDPSDSRFNAAREERGRTGKVRCELTCIRADGTKFPVELSSVLLDEGTSCYVMIRDLTERKRAERSLRESEERYRSLFENLTEGYAYCKMIFDDGVPIDWIYLAVNDSFAKLTGLENAAGKRVTEAIPGIREIDPELFDIYGRVATTGKPEKFETFVESLKMWFHISVYSPEQDHFVAVFDVITDRKNAEAALRESEERYRGLFENMTEAYAYHRMIFDEGKPIDYEFLAVNEAFEKMTGLKDVHGRRITELIPGIRGADPELFARYGRIASTGKPEKFESFVESMKMWFQISAYSPEPGYFVAVFDNITDRKNAEIKLRQSEELFSKAFHGSPITMVITSLIDNRILDVNKAFEESTGYPREEVLGRDFRSIGLWIDPQGAEDALRAVVAAGQYHGLEYEFLTKSGECRIGRLSAELAEVAGEPCVLTVGEDITDRKKTEVALKKSEELFSKAFHASPMAMAVFSLSDQRMLDVNEAFLRQSGYAREEIIGRTPLESMVMFDREKMERLHRELLMNGFIHGQECPYRTRSGEPRIGYFSAEIAEIGGSPCILLVADDITDRKRAAETLKESNRIQSELLAKLNEAQKIAAVGSWEWNLTTDRVWWSDETYRIFGFEPGDFTPSFEANANFIHPDDLGMYRDSFERSLQTDEPLEIDVRLLANGGALKFCHAKGEIIRDDSGQAGRFFGTIMDVTEKKRAEEALQANEERFRLMFENMSSGVAIYDAVEGGADFVIREFNPAAERICKTTREKVVGHKVSEMFPGAADIGLTVAFRRVWEKGFSERLHSSSYHDERLSFWVDNFVFKLPTGEIVAFFDDITERKLAEIELRRNEIWYRSLIELGVSVYTVVDAKRQIHYVSPIARKIFGWNPEDYFRKSFFDFVIPDDLEAVSRFFAELLSVPGRKKRLLTKMLCKDGSYKVMELFGVNLIDEPAVQGIVLSSHDITEQVKSRERLDAIRAELNHATRLASMGALSAGIAHEINQPLSIMATWAEVAMREIREKLTGDSEEALFALKRIDAALQRSGEIIRRMKDFARRSEPRVSTVDLTEAIDEVHLLLGHQLREAGVEISVEMDREIPPTFADRVQVHQVLVNLILNALEAMQTVDPQGRKVKIAAKVGEGELEVAVSDTGCGIPPDRLENVFDPFHSTKAEGLGLGLSICRSIIEWHSGRIWAARNPDRGTTITFTLPIVKEKLRHATENHHFYRR